VQQKEEDEVLQKVEKVRMEILRQKVWQEVSLLQKAKEEQVQVQQEEKVQVL
jgi:hypothetical protein